MGSGVLLKEVSSGKSSLRLMIVDVKLDRPGGTSLHVSIYICSTVGFPHPVHLSDINIFILGEIYNTNQVKHVPLSLMAY